MLLLFWFPRDFYLAYLLILVFLTTIPLPKQPSHRLVALLYQQQQQAAAAAPTAGADANKTVQFNRYENSDLGISLKYPSNFLIDESKSNERLQQISFFPPANTSVSPEQPILWMGVLIQSLNPVSDNASSSSSNASSPASNLNIETYAESLANSIQQGNEDVTVIEKSTNTLLSGHPAYKLVTQSYFNNSTIIDVQIGTIFNNKHLFDKLHDRTVKLFQFPSCR